jgi:hypothetical protein
MSFAARIAPGEILYLRAAFPHEHSAKDRYWVVAGIDDGLLLLLKINTSPELSAIAKKKKELQFKLKRESYDFLEYDSYLDCGQVWKLLSAEGAAEQLRTRPERVKGMMTDDHKNEITRLTGISKSIAPRDKRIVAEALGRSMPG